MDVIEGTIDWEALKSGNYVLYALTADDNGNIIDDPNIHVGDTLHFNHVQMNGLSSSIDNNFDCKVMAKVLINENTDTIRSTGFAKFYIQNPTIQGFADTNQSFHADIFPLAHVGNHVGGQTGGKPQVLFPHTTLFQGIP